jgi:ribosomal protein S18 acetylase RimI-like enzyme
MTGAALLDQVEFRRPTRELEAGLTEFFAALVAAGDDERFHPHPFTAASAAARSAYRGKDVYCVATVGPRVLGYALLRGWDEGYEVPSLGIAVHPDARGLGLGRALMLFLHVEARRRGAPRIRLKVYPDNERAVALYRSLGYAFRAELDHGQLVAFKELGTAA